MAGNRQSRGQPFPFSMRRSASGGGSCVQFGLQGQQSQQPQSQFSSAASIPLLRAVNPGSSSTTPPMGAARNGSGASFPGQQSGYGRPNAQDRIPAETGCVAANEPEAFGQRERCQLRLHVHAPIWLRRNNKINGTH